MTATEPLPAAIGWLDRLADFLLVGGPAMWAIVALSVASLALVLWKLWHMTWLGAFSGGRASARALALWDKGDHAAALALLAPRHSARARVIRTAMLAADDAALPRDAAEAATEQVLAEARSGLRGLELAASVGPLLGLLGTVTGMIAAFQGLEAAGARADTATLAGGIWEALLTTAAGMGVAIPAMIALTWFDGIVDSLRHDMEDGATGVFLAQDRQRAKASK